MKSKGAQTDIVDEYMRGLDGVMDFVLSFIHLVFIQVNLIEIPFL
jgi:hypothetical protein